VVTVLVIAWYWSRRLLVLGSLLLGELFEAGLCGGVAVGAPVLVVGHAHAGSEPVLWGAGDGAVADEAGAGGVDAAEVFCGGSVDDLAAAFGLVEEGVGVGDEVEDGGDVVADGVGEDASVGECGSFGGAGVVGCWWAVCGPDRSGVGVGGFVLADAVEVGDVGSEFAGVVDDGVEAGDELGDGFAAAGVRRLGPPGGFGVVRGTIRSRMLAMS
jgi:hypothetical protein